METIEISLAWKYVLPLLLLAVVSVVMVIIGWVNRRSIAGNSYFFLMLTMTLWMIFYSSGLLVQDVNAYRVLMVIEYLTIVALPFFWLIYALTYTQVQGWNSPGMISILILPPLVLFAMAALDVAPNLLFNHHRFFGLSTPYTWDFERRAWTFIHIAYSLTYFIIGTVLVIRHINRNPKMDMRQSVLLSLGVLVPWIGNITFIFRVSPIEKLDLAPFAFVLSGSLLAWGLFYKKFLNLISVARQVILERMADGLIVLDRNDWIVDINPAAQSILRISALRAINTPAVSIMAPYPDLIDNIRYPTRRHQEVSIHHADKQFYFDLSISPLIDNKGSLVGKMLILHDITSLKLTELKLKEAKNRAEEADTLKSAFLANMSHEIRTPMNAIVGFSNLLNDPAISEEERAEFIQHIRNSSNNLLQLIDDIIDISKLDANQIEPGVAQVLLKQVMTELYTYYNEYIEESGNSKLQLSLKIPTDKQNITAILDGTRLRQILQHLLDNAVKFTEEGFVEYGYDIVEDKYIQFYVKDTGIGIPYEKQSLIFERFGRVFTGTRQDYGGTGLGLSLSKGFVELMGGRIWVESVLGKGSTFYFTVPYQPGTEYMPSETPLKEYEEILHPEGEPATADLELKPPPQESVKTAPVEAEPVEPEAKPGHEPVELPKETPVEPGLIYDTEVNKPEMPEPEEKHSTILIIEPDEMSYLFLEMVMRPKKWHVVWTRNLKEALNYLADNAPADLVILDSDLPDASFNDSIAGIRRKGIHRKIVALVPFKGSAAARKAMEAGCQDTVSKPVKPALLLDAIEKLLS